MLSGGTAWMAPFILAAKGLVPITKLRGVEGYKTRGVGQDFTQGCTTLYDNGLYTISLATHIRSAGDKYTKRNVGMCLEVLSHELSHLKTLEHTPERWELELQISKRFAKLLKKWGIKDTTIPPERLEFV